MRRQEYMLKKKAWRFGRKGAWRQMSMCLVCEDSLPTWRGPLGDRVCPGCIDRLDKEKYA
jgi:hypothetical protein